MVRMMAIIFGIGFIFAGVAGYLSHFMQDGLLFGLFEVDTMHNMIHIASGVIAILSAISLKYAKWYFRIFGLVYAAVAVLGFLWNGDFSMFMMHMNMADNYLHAGIAIVALYLGFLA